MKNVAGIWFTFSGDAACLAISVASFRAAGGGPVCIFDEAANPLSAEQLSVVEPDFYAQTPPRGGNLNGWDTCKIMLQATIDVEKAFPDIIGSVKIDSDTNTHSLRWVDTTKKAVGWDLGAGCYGYGMARYVARDMSALALDHISTRMRFGKAPEDQAIWGTLVHVIQQRYKNAVVLHTGRPATPGGFRAGSYQYAELDAPLVAPAEEYDMLTFGSRSQLTIPKEQQRDYAAVVMERVWKKVLASKVKA